ncbi:MAG: SAM-dependent methyltransferase [Cyclobacteriaceae bacterium]
MKKLDADYWTERYINEQTGWDTNGITTPLKEYFDQLSDRNMKILIPGAGNAYEAGYLWKQGFRNVYVMDWSETPLKNFAGEYDDFPSDQLLNEDFFAHDGVYDLIIEQTFFCAFEPKLRSDYARKISKLLNTNGKLVGLLWNCDFESGPPFGGSEQEYRTIFDPFLTIEKMELCYNSIKPRTGREYFVIMRKS